MPYLRQLVLRKRIPSRAPRRRWDSPLRALPGCCFPGRLGRRRLPPLRKWALHRCLRTRERLQGGRRSRQPRPLAGLFSALLVCVRHLASCLPSDVVRRRVQPGKGKELGGGAGGGLGWGQVLGAVEEEAGGRERWSRSLGIPWIGFKLTRI